MTSDANGLWPHDPEALDDNRTVDDLEIPDDDDEDEVPDLDEWGDDADNRPVDLDDDDTDIDDLDR
ncbi:hypothetical protein [Cryobacterium sp. AP23]